MDSSFYRVPSARTVAQWGDLIGPGFGFCPKWPKTLSHEKRLENPAAEIALLRQLADELGPRFGCALLQLPPAFQARPHEETVLRKFLLEWPVLSRWRSRSATRVGTPRRVRGFSRRGVWFRSGPTAEPICVCAHNHYGGMAVETMRRLVRNLGLPLPSQPEEGRQLDLFGRKGLV